MNTDTTFDNPKQKVIYNKLNELISPRFHDLEGKTYSLETVNRYVLHVISYKNGSGSKKSKHSCIFDFKVFFYDGLFYIKHRDKFFFDRHLKMLLEEFASYMYEEIDDDASYNFRDYTIEIVEFPPSLLD